MADSLYDLLFPTPEPGQDTESRPAATSTVTNAYLKRLSTLSVSSLTTTEPESLLYDSQSVLKSLQALSKRSHRSINTALDSLSHLNSSLPEIITNADNLQHAIPQLEENAISFAEKYSKTSENLVLDRRKRAMRIGDNIDRLSDILELPTLLASAISASSSTAPVTTSQISSANANYASALDLYTHIRRLQRLYPSSDLVKSIAVQAEEAMRGMTTNLITTMRSQNLKLAGAMRLIGLLRRVAPELDADGGKPANWASSGGEGALGSLFLVCRVANLIATLEALEPLRELAEQETTQRQEASAKAAGQQRSDRSNWSAGQQTERYLKRYVEIFREQCFAIVSMYKSIFPTTLQGPTSSTEVGSQQDKAGDETGDPLQQLPPALATFTLHVVDMLVDTLRTYLPNVEDQSSRDSLLTQVLYCAGSLGRLGGDFGMVLALLDEEIDVDKDEEKDEELPEWMDIMKKHRVQAGRLELLASGVGAGTVSGRNGADENVEVA